jgi:hypothetical protein
LTKGFGVKSFRLQRLTGDESSSGLAFTWEPPVDTSIVHCALFACRPTVRQHTRDGEQVREIVNYDNCVIARELFEPGSGVFDLTNPALQYTPKTTPAPGCVSGGPRRVSELAVACWAYDTTSLIAATPMEAIDGKGMYNYHDLFVDDCGADHDGPVTNRACIVEESGRIGSCFAGACHELCVDNADCLPPDVVREPILDAGSDAGGGDADVEGGGDAATPELSVCFKEGYYVGVCVLPSELEDKS